MILHCQKIMLLGLYCIATSLALHGQTIPSTAWESTLDSVYVHWDRGQVDKADSTVNLLWSSMREQDSLYQYLEGVRAVAKYWRASGEPQLALGYYQLGLPESLWRPVTDSLEIDALGWLFVNLGFTYGDALGQYQRSLSWYKKADRLFSDANVVNYWVGRFVWVPLGNLYTRLGDFDAAERQLQRYLSLVSALHHETAIAKGWIDLGLLYESWNKPEQAKSAYELALNNRSLPVQTKIQLLGNLTVLQLNQENTNLAEHYNFRAVELLASVKDIGQNGFSSGKRVIFKNQALVAQAKGDFELAASFFEDAYDHLYSYYGNTQRREFGKHHIQVGQLYFEQARYREAAISFQEALVSVVYRYCPEDLLELPTAEQCYAENTMMDALEGLAKKFAAWYEEDDRLVLLEQALEAREHMHLVSEELRKVYLYEGSQLQNLEDIRSRSEAGIALANRLAKLTGDAEYGYRAFLFAERDRSQLLRSAYQHEQATASELSPGQQKAENDWQYQVQQAEATLYQLQASNASDSLLSVAEQALWQARNGRYEFLQQLEQDNPRYYQLKYADDTPSLSALQSMLKPGQLLVEFFIGKEQLYAFTLGKEDELVLHELPLPQALEDRVMAWRHSIDAYQQPNEDRTALLATYREEGSRLYEELLAPILSGRAITSLLLIPSGVLDMLPFEALLQQPVVTGSSLKDYPFLLRAYPVSYGYSASLQYVLAQLSQAGKGLVAYSPAFDGQLGWQPLSCSSETLASLPWSGRREHFLDTAANRRNFLQNASEFQVLHLATHAQANAERGDFSFIVFSDGKGGYDSLFAQSLYHLDLASELVVLSACETALGTLYDSEGVISLARGFHYAGVRSVLTTLWQVNEDANCRILPTFYSGLKAGKDKASALHLAKLAYLKDADQRAAHPVYWAGLQLTGHAAPLPDEQVFSWLTFLLTIAGLIIVWNVRRRAKVQNQLARCSSETSSTYSYE